MSLLQILSLAWGISAREVQRTLSRGVPGFRREGRNHYRVSGPITAARLRRVRPLDRRLPIAVWLSGSYTLWAASKACNGPEFLEAVSRAAPHMREARVVLLALETRIAKDFKSSDRDHFLRRQETATTFERYRPRIKGELIEAQFEPRFAELRNSLRRLINAGVAAPTRRQSAIDMGISERSHFARFSRRSWLRAANDDAEVEAKGPVEVMLEAMWRLAEAGIDGSPEDVAEELGYGRADEMFGVFTRGEYEEALARFERGVISQPVEEARGPTDTGQRDSTKRAAKARRPR
jgi:hypothetical protein